jgi:hypothetical protein
VTAAYGIENLTEPLRRPWPLTGAQSSDPDRPAARTTAGLALTGADFGNVQIADPATGSLILVTQVGLGPEFPEHFTVVGGDSQSVCGWTATHRAQTVVADVRYDPGFAPHREIAGAAG